MFFVEMGFSSFSLHGRKRSFLSSMNWNTYTLFLKAEGALSMFTKSELSSVF